ncbi:hypothetical protein CFK40_13645 [Virgibacillus necropolis]|uniref:Uncharacterized protein n=1 Tax=Virgibacillus necropolis TaxID=163877 RepID=A0A221ME85_9BACI|nr:hypothetical protein CFK40_13645 [Virgibacillus necropolis]
MVLFEKCNKYHLEIYKNKVKSYYVGVTLAYMNDVVNSTLTINEKHKIISSILNDEEFYKDILIYRCPYLYYKAHKLICIQRNVNIFNKFVLAKNKFNLM